MVASPKILNKEIFVQAHVRIDAKIKIYWHFDKRLLIKYELIIIVDLT
jgi:hypothetical protein